MRNRIKRGAPAVAGPQAAMGAAAVAPSFENPNPQLGGPQQTIVERANDPEGDGKLVPTPMPAMRGGSFGIIPEAEKRVHFHLGKPLAQGQTGRSAPKPPKKFIVTDGPRNGTGKVTFMYDHQRVAVSIGKEILETAYDVDMLRRQGVRLEEIVDPLAEAREEEPTSAPQLASDESNDDANDEGDEDDKE